MFCPPARYGVSDRLGIRTTTITFDEMDEALEQWRDGIDQRRMVQTVYIYDPFEDAGFRFTPGEGWYVQRRGRPEFKAVPGSKLVTEAYLQFTPDRELTAEQYASLAL